MAALLQVTVIFLNLYIQASRADSDIIRKSVDSLSPEDVLNLQKALRAVIEDTSNKGYTALAAYHGYPPQCKFWGQDVGCCVHGKTVFPHWHRLYTVQLEQALIEKGLTIGIPYWDWTRPMTGLPAVARNPLVLDSDGRTAKENSWFQGRVNIDGVEHNTARAVDPRLFQKAAPGQHTFLFEQILNALEYHNYCQFEVQLEVAHNSIHYLVGGRNKYSLSHLEYSSYDPLFFLHHSNVDRIYSVYQALQQGRGHTPGPGCTGECENCDVQQFQTPLEPFSRESNPFPITRENSRPRQAHHSHVLGYKFENLSLGGYDLSGLTRLLQEKISHDRAFATFRLYGIKTSVNVRVKVCTPASGSRRQEICKSAGDFFILGGPLEMPWVFARPFYFDITKTVLSLGLNLTENYHVKTDLYSVNGTRLPAHSLPAPYVHFRPAKGKPDPPLPHNDNSQEKVTLTAISVRKDVDRLTREEIYELREALHKFQNDRSIDGYQAMAEFHGEPGKCPSPTANRRSACCIHGIPTFPHWHRLFVVQFEDGLRRRGAQIGVPYWDWTKPNTVVPSLAAESAFTDPYSNEEKTNPFHGAEIVFLNKSIHTSRNVSASLSQTPQFGDHTELFDQFLLALEQDNFCDFEIQFQMAHNLIHLLVGGSTQYGLSSLSYSSFDPLFYLHHSNVDRIWAIWTALQQHRGKPYKAHCVQSFVNQPLKPFSFEPPFNNNKKTFQHSTPTDIYAYETELGYAYDSLEFGGLAIAELDAYINTNLKGKSRTFAGLQLWGIKTSALAEVYVNVPGGDKYKAGRFAILGGPSETNWGFDRLFRLDITEGLEAIGVKFYEQFDVTMEMRDYNGAPVDAWQFPPIQVIHRGKEGPKDARSAAVHTRKNVDLLSPEEVMELRTAMTSLQQDKSPGGFQNLGRYHGTPKWCPSPDAGVKKSCCIHGMPTFPHWHRLWTVQAENALRLHGYHDGLPYWDWTLPLAKLPDLVNTQNYTDPKSGQEVANPFYSAHIDDVDADTVREIRSDLFEQPDFGIYTEIAKQVLLALEQDDFCNFEVQFEIAHNFIHALVGGSQLYSVASLKYTAFDPIFYLHHSNTDRIWAIWQELQRYRGKPYNSANCAIGGLRKPLSPFSLTSDVNPDPVTRENSLPFKVFDYRANFHYHYDNLEFNGLSIPQLVRVLEQNKARDRVFVGFLLHGVHQSALVKFYICVSEDNCNSFAGEFYLLGDANEMDWTYDRLYKYDITQQLEALSLRYDDHYYVRYEVLSLNGSVIQADSLFDTRVFRTPGTSDQYRQELRQPVATASHVRRDLESLSEGEVESLRSALLHLQNDHTYEKIASFHGKPGLCQREGRSVACCVHGRPTFLAWHRLYVKEVEIALLSRGSNVAVPYWDWTRPLTKLPDLISEPAYFNSRQQQFEPNPFFSGAVAIEQASTIRNPRPELFNNAELYEQTLLALEQDNFCDFEIQLEVLHNRLHSLLGGRAKFSMASLDYAAFDPVFFLHHSNTDRIWAIWQELQRHRGLAYNQADCAINFMRTPLLPFGGQSADRNSLTFRYSRPSDVFDYRNHLHYEYNTLEFNHMTIPQLENLLKRRQEHGRVFAGFLLHNIGTTADVDIFICVSSGSREKADCDHKAGTFSILGGEVEMPFVFDRLYKHDITTSVHGLGFPLDSAANFEVIVEIKASNGSVLDSSILPAAAIMFVPGSEETQDASGNASPYLVRKDVDSLNPREKLSLIHALRGLQADRSAEGYQAIAAFHAVPPLCPSPEASERHACCIHGMATFPHWHRLYTVQVEDGLRRHGSLVGLPYWNWAGDTVALPGFLADASFTDPYTGVVYDNPFNNATIDFENAVVEREVLGQYLQKRGPHGWDTWLFEQTLLALEQEDFCDFEIQLEVTHNAIHSWLGGSKEYSMGHLHYASYDPVFFLHHSNTDRLWAVWQVLQKHRGHSSNEVNCALELMKEPLKPFSFGSPYNLNPITHSFSRPEDTFDYSGHFNYRYDDLEFAGMNVPALDTFIKERQGHDRVFAGFLLSGFGTSAFVDFEICRQGKCFEAGYFTILGGSAEMPWHFDRLFKYDITAQLKEHDLQFEDEYEFKVHVKYPNGTEIPSHPVPDPIVLLEPAKQFHSSTSVAPNRIRHDLGTLSERDITSLQAALYDLQQDTSNDGWAHLASFHGAPARCTDPDHPTVACCQHGMPTFPHWHRLFTLQVEQALARHGSPIAIPYWDWTIALTELPNVFTQTTFHNVWRDEVYINPFSRGYVPSEQAYTVRDVQAELFETSRDGRHSKLFDLVLSALEQVDFCDFEVQFEVMHNAIHYLVGGHQTYSLSSLEYSAYDPIFFIHHSFTDKVWIVWQKLQQRRHLPYDRADCAVNSMNEPMKPFSFEGFNENRVTREHAVPSSVFDHEDLGYGYDNLNIGGHTIEQLEKLINERHNQKRVFAGFLLKGVKTSGTVFIKICQADGKCTKAGNFNILGGPTESPWAYDRLYKKEITQYLTKANLLPEDVFDSNKQIHLEVEVFDVEGHSLSPKDVFPTPTIIFYPGASDTEVAASTSVAGVGIRKDVSHLTTSEIKNLRDALRRVQNNTGPNGFQNIASFHGSPARCEHDHHPVACCLHGMANFPQWHRLYVKQWEDALTSQGAKIGIPYWDWTTAFTELPPLVTEEKDNPFHHGRIYNGEITTRAPRDKLFNDPELGKESFFYRQVLLAFEQTDYCDFEVQYEITHNAIHSWTGGQSPYGMSTLEYTAYDPLFLLHHSNVDRQFAIWQALQKFRGLPYNTANCAIQLLHQPMRPFSDEDNVNPTTHANSRASDAFNYDRLGYQYDDLNFHGHTISELNDILEERKSHDRIFAEFLLHGIETSADVTFELCDEVKHCAFAGTFAVLGGPLEMPWAFDRLFRYDVTDVFHKLHLQADSEYHFVDHIVAVNGTELDSHLIKPPSVLFVPGTKGPRRDVPKTTVVPSDKLLRKNVNQLTLGEAANLKDALHKLQEDQGPSGYEAIAGFHGAPFLCPENGDQKYACCVHGMPVFPHWHRLFTVQFEQALKEHGSVIGVPYWDWTAPGRALPPFLTDSGNDNPFSSYTIGFAGQKTTRSPLDELFSTNTSDGHTLLYSLTLDALEEVDFCNFEIMLEFLHNRVHFFIGGSDTYSMSTLDYSAFDPIFMIVHSSMDRIWVLWQELQKRRLKPFSGIDCGDYSFNKPLHPFDYPGVNTIALTQQNAVPNSIFDYSRLGYEYDSIHISGYQIDQLEDIIKNRNSKTRIYLCGAAYGVGLSLYTEVWLYNEKGDKFSAGRNYLLGSSKEMPWSNEILWKYDVTDAFQAAGVDTSKPTKVHFSVSTYNGKLFAEGSEYSVVGVREAYTDYLIINFPIGAKTYPLPPKLIVPKGTRVRFIPVAEEYNYPIENLVSLTNLNKCTLPPFPFNSYAVNVIHALEPGNYYFASSNKEVCDSFVKIYLVVQDH